MASYIDLTMTLEDGMRGVEHSVAKTITDDGWNASTYHLYSHAGTHLDAPVHFDVKMAINTLDKFPLERFFFNAWLVDLPDLEDQALITVKELGHIKKKAQRGDGLLFRTGWSQHINTSQYRDALPRISQELVSWCSHTGIAFIGVEPPSVADVNNIEELTQIHKAIFEADILIAEGLTNLDQITQDKVQIVALPLKIKNSDGCPARIIAIEQ